MVSVNILTRTELYAFNRLSQDLQTKIIFVIYLQFLGESLQWIIVVFQLMVSKCEKIETCQYSYLKNQKGTSG
jgi:hypothetical protein